MTDDYTNAGTNPQKLDRTESLARLNSAYLPVLYEQLLKAVNGNQHIAKEGIQEWIRGQNTDVTTHDLLYYAAQLSKGQTVQPAVSAATEYKIEGGIDQSRIPPLKSTFTSVMGNSSGSEPPAPSGNQQGPSDPATKKKPAEIFVP